jgi:Na+-driven multidrug efflux pump
MIGALIFTGLFDLQRRFLQAMGYPNGPMLCQLTGVALQIILNSLFVAEYGLVGVGYSTLVT